MIRTAASAAACATLIVMAPCAGSTAPATAAMPLPLASAVAHKTIELVETRGVYPRHQDEYDQARAALLALLDENDSAGQVAYQALFARIGTLLGTLDANGHSFILPAAPSPPAGQDLAASPTAQAMVPGAPTLALIPTGHGKVLHWTPPAIVDGTPERSRAYAQRFLDEADALPGIGQACALVVDLSAQTGGNAWPPLVAMRSLFGDANQAYMVDRDGRRNRLVYRAQLEEMARADAGKRADPLGRYAALPLAVVVGSRTSSAGEMLLVALLGENRVQTFGHVSDGRSTLNFTHVLPDGSQLLLTEQRYAVGSQPVYRGGIAPMHPLADDARPGAAVTEGAEWAAAASPMCRTAAAARR